MLVWSALSSQVDYVGTYQCIDSFENTRLIVNSDFSFKFEYRGSSCWTWSNRYGTWSLSNDTLVMEELRISKDPTVLISENLSSYMNEDVVIRFMTMNGEPVQNLSIRYINRMDLEDSQTGITNDDGLVHFGKIVESTANPLVGVILEFSYNECGELQFYQIGASDKSNSIEIYLDSIPFIETTVIVDKYVTKEDEIIGLESNSWDGQGKFVRIKSYN